MNKKIQLIAGLAGLVMLIGAGCQASNTETSSILPYSGNVEPTETTETITIKELGITIEIPVQYTADLAYKVEKGSYEGSVTVGMYSKNVMGQDSNCGVGSLGRIIQSSKLYTMDDEVRELDSRQDIQVGNDYITIHGPQDTCTGDKELQKAVSDRAKALHLALPTVRALSSSTATTDTVTYQAPEIGLGKLLNDTDDKSIKKWYFVRDGKSTEKYSLIFDDTCLVDAVGSMDSDGFMGGSCMKYLSIDKNKNILYDGYNGPAVRIHGKIMPNKSIQVSNITIVQ